MHKIVVNDEFLENFQTILLQRPSLKKKIEKLIDDKFLGRV